MRMARERAGITQDAAAIDLGLSGRSKSTLSAWEAGRREPKLSMIARMAVLYGVPVEFLTNPPMTAYELIDERLSDVVRGAEALEREDWEGAEQPAPKADVARGAARRRRPA